MSAAGADKFFRGLSSVRLDMLDLLGAVYMMDAVIDAINARRETEMYWEYSAECLRGIGASLGMKIVSFHDILHPQPIDTRSGLEIAVDMLDKFGIKAEN